MLKSNIGPLGRVLRGIAAVILLVYGIWQGSWIALLFSAFIFFETYMSWCAFNQLLGKSGCPIDTKKPPK